MDIDRNAPARAAGDDPSDDRRGDRPEPAPLDEAALAALKDRIRAWAEELGFGALAVADTAGLAEDAGARLRAWLARAHHGGMDWMVRHVDLREQPSRLLPGCRRAICVTMPYRPRADPPDWIGRETARLDDGETAVVSLHARARDYHKVLRGRLAQLAARIGAAAAGHGFRACVDSAPVFEVELARRAGLGWRGKHTLLLSREAGSTFFLGEILTDLPLPVDETVSDHCGRCERCIDACPTRAIVAPYELDARRCISYLTIEHEGDIPESLRPGIGNRVYGCDDCQLACPWNRYAQVATLADFDVRNGLDRATLVELFGWDEDEFRRRHQGSSIARIGYERWSRNLAVALGNARPTAAVIGALRSRAADRSPMVRRHVAWALARHGVAAGDDAVGDGQ